MQAIVFHCGAVCGCMIWMAGKDSHGVEEKDVWLLYIQTPNSPY